jgi:hypothetical protein
VTRRFFRQLLTTSPIVHCKPHFDSKHFKMVVQTKQHQQSQSTSAPISPAPSNVSNPFDSPAPSVAGFNIGNPFASRSPSQAPSVVGGLYRRGPKDFRSRRVDKTKIQTPWTAHKDPKEKWVTILPVLAIIIGLCASGALVYQGYSSVPRHNYKLVLSDDFSSGFNSDIWTKEIQVGGFG